MSVDETSTFVSGALTMMKQVQIKHITSVVVMSHMRTQKDVALDSSMVEFETFGEVTSAANTMA